MVPSKAYGGESCSGSMLFTNPRVLRCFVVTPVTTAMAVQTDVSS